MHDPDAFPIGALYNARDLTHGSITKTKNKRLLRDEKMSNSKYDKQQQDHSAELERKKQAAYQRDIGSRGHSTGSAANAAGLRDYQAAQGKKRRDSNFNSAFEKEAKKHTGCFPADTRVTCIDGPREIVNIARDDLVLSIDREGRLRFSRVLKVAAHPACRLWKVVFSDGSTLKTTARQSLCVNERRSTVREIKPGDEVTSIWPGPTVGRKAVAEISALTDYEHVFNLIVEGDFSFVANNSVAYSFTYLPRLRAAVWTIREIVRALATSRLHGNTASSKA